MTFTYGGTPSVGTTDEIRFLLQDTDANNPIFQDEEIQYFMDRAASVNGSTLKTAAYLAETAAARFAREVTINSDGTSIAMEQLQQKYEELSARLRGLAVELDNSGTGPIVGGNNWDDWWYGGRKVFRMRANDNIRAGSQNDCPDNYWIDYEYGGWWEGQGG